MPIRSKRRIAVGAVATALALLGTSCAAPVSTGAGTGTGTNGAGSSGAITVVMHYPSPPQKMLDAFTKDTGIKVNWVQMGFEDIQAKIGVALSSNSYFADATDVDWSRVGEFEKTGWFQSLNDHFNVADLKKDAPQVDSFIMSDKLMGVPFDSSFLLGTMNTDDFKKAGITKTPETLDEYDAALKSLKSSGVKTPLDLSYAAYAATAQCWYQLSAAFGQPVVDESFTPQFTSPDSPGYKAMEWMVNAYKDGTVPKAAVNLTEVEGYTTMMAPHETSTGPCDTSGTVGTIYSVPSLSKVVDKMQYMAVPGVKGPTPSLANPDGIGIPKTAKNVDGAVKFITWFTSTENQAIWAGLNGPDQIIEGFPLPMRVSSLDLLASKDKLPQAKELAALLHNSAPMFPGKAPAGYVGFYEASYTHIHQAAAGQETVAQAIAAIAEAATKVKASLGK